MDYYCTQGFVKNMTKPIVGALLVKAESHEEAKEKLRLYGKENADIDDLSMVTESEMWASVREGIEKPNNLREILDGVFVFVEDQSWRLWRWLGKESKGDLTKDLNLCFEVFSQKLEMEKEENPIEIIFVQYEEGFFKDGTTWHCMGALEDEGNGRFSFMEGYGFNPAMAFCDAMEYFIGGGERIKV